MTSYDKRSRHPLYKYWNRMRSAINSPSSKEYAYAGARGNKFAEEIADFWDFVAWVESELGYGQPGQTLTRIDTSKDYTKNNIAWQQRYINGRKPRPEREELRFFGICYDSHGKTKPWKAQISLNGKAVYIGYFKTQEEAARAYDKEAKKAGKRMNFPEESS